MKMPKPRKYPVKRWTDPVRPDKTWEVCEVTSLADAGEGTLRQALMYDRPRVVIFMQGGDIRIKTPLIINRGKCIVYGDSAPMFGVQVRGSGLRVEDCSDVWIDNLRVRAGESTLKDDYAFLVNGRNPGAVDRVYASECSFSGGKGNGETVGVWGGVGEVILRSCIVSRPILSQTEAGPHCTGVTVGGRDSYDIFFLMEGCLIAQSGARNPGFFPTGGRYVFRENFVADVQSYMMEVQPQNPTKPFVVRVQGNVFQHGPSSTARPYRRPIACAKLPPECLEVSGNLCIGSLEGGTTRNQSLMAGYKASNPSTSQMITTDTLLATTYTKQASYRTAASVLARVGPRVRDRWDEDTLQAVVHGRAFNWDKDWSLPEVEFYG